MKKLALWVNTHVKQFMDLETRKGSAYSFNYKFHRKNNDPIIRDSNLMYSPASGTVVFADIVEDPSDQLIQVKGRNFSIDDLMHKKMSKGRYFCCSIFMSFYDQHSNYVPYDGIYKDYIDLPPLQTHNVSMLDLEKCIIDNKMIKHDHMDYLFENQRRLNTFVIPKMENYTYYITQIADVEVNQIVSYHSFDEYSTNFVQQGKPFGKIQKGSSCELILPLDNAPFEIENIYPDCSKNIYHVEAGTDPTIRIKHNKKDEEYTVNVCETAKHGIFI